MWLMLQQETPDDFAIGTGEAHTVREFVELAFTYASLDWKDHVEVDPRYFRPTEVELLIGDPRKARERLGWRHQTDFAELVAEMVREDLELVGRNAPKEKHVTEFIHV